MSFYSVFYKYFKTFKHLKQDLKKLVAHHVNLSQTEMGLS